MTDQESPSSSRRLPVLGLDVGGVIISNRDVTTDTFGSPVDGALEAIPKLCELFNGRVRLISKAREETQRLTREWLARNGFWKLTGLSTDALIFCAERCDKGPIVARERVTHFVDDRAEVMAYLRTIERGYLFDPDPAELALWAKAIPVPHFAIVNRWSDLAKSIRHDLENR